MYAELDLTPLSDWATKDASKRTKQYLALIWWYGTIYTQYTKQ